MAKSSVISLFCIFILVRGQQYRCDYTFYEEAGGWLKYHEIPANWREARTRCHLEGAVLASPLTPGLNNAMSKVTHAHQPDCGVFLGVHATFSSGDFFSMEGVPLWKIPHTWSKGEPDNEGHKENCLVQLPDGTWADVNCEDTFPYICYKKKTKTLVVTSCGTTDPGYNLDTRTGSCYKFHRVPRTWSRAFMACSAEGAYLTIINSDVEAAVIKELLAKNPAASMLGNFWKDGALIGFHDWHEHGEWLTIHGQTLAEAGYEKFSPGQPDNATTGEFCGSVFRSGLLNDIWCENKIAFICEKDPGSLICDDFVNMRTNIV